MSQNENWNNTRKFTEYLKGLKKTNIINKEEDKNFLHNSRFLEYKILNKQTEDSSSSEYSLNFFLQEQFL